MKIIYDNETDSIYVKFTDDAVVESEERDDGTIVDYNKKDEIVAVEVLNVKTNPYEIDIPTILKSA
ncbi:MAG: DUF2283 domain-containing protein [Campylobacterota bacterium]|nr:DUF2283 domain-containing protein [Campylobacterota bacterium]